MNTFKTILTLFIGVVIGAMAYYFFSQFQSTANPLDGLKISYSTSQPEGTARETAFANQYATFHRARNLAGLLAMGKFDGGYENIDSSRKSWMQRSFAQQIVGMSFRELTDSEIRKSADFSLEPMLECTITFAQNNPDDVMRSTTCILGVEGGYLYIVDRVKK